MLHFFRFIASVRVKQEPVTQTQREPGDLDPTRFRSETYDPPKSSICEFQRKACPSYTAVDFTGTDTRCIATGRKAGTPGCPTICRWAFQSTLG
jgi:hypothetical protein